MAFETPILSTRVYGVPDLITDGANGMLCDTRDVRALRELLERGAALSAQERAAMGAASRATVLKVHDPLIYEEHFLDRLTTLSRTQS